MKDQVALSVTYFTPVPRCPDEKFPVLFKFLPYRKDDPIPMAEDEDNAYFAKRGLIMAKVDIRGTDGSALIREIIIRPMTKTRP